MSASAAVHSGDLFERPSPRPPSEIGMRKSGAILPTFGEISPQIFAERVAAFLRMRHPQKTALCVEAVTRIPAKTVAKWLEGAAAPNGRSYHQLLRIYGLELFVYVNPDASCAEIREAARLQQQSRLEHQNEALRRQLAAQHDEIWGRP